MAKYCSACGTPLTDGDVFCSSCGRPCGTAPAMPTSAQVHTYDLYSDAPSPTIKAGGFFQRIASKIRARPALTALCAGALILIILLAILLPVLLGRTGAPSNTTWQGAVKNYMHSLSGKPCDVNSLYPDFCWDYSSKKLNIAKRELVSLVEDATKEQVASAEEAYGKGFALNYSVVGKQALSRYELEDISYLLCQQYDTNIRATEGYALEVSLLVSGSNNSFSDTVGVYVIKINECWYIGEFDSWYEEFYFASMGLNG